jgi:hypothetical protein
MSYKVSAAVGGGGRQLRGLPGGGVSSIASRESNKFSLIVGDWEQWFSDGEDSWVRELDIGYRTRQTARRAPRVARRSQAAAPLRRDLGRCLESPREEGCLNAKR